MGNQYQCALEALQLRNECLNRLQIQVIRRLVQDQHIRFLESDPTEDEPGRFTAGQRTHFLFTVVLSEQHHAHLCSHEAAVPTCTEIPEPLLRCFFTTLEFFLVILGEVAEVGFIAPLDFALIRFELAHHDLQQRRLSDPVGAHDRHAISPMNE